MVSILDRKPLRSYIPSIADVDNDKNPHIPHMVWIMVFKVTLNNISVISWRSVLLVAETGGIGENHRPVARQ
jgi:hypothetical protein